MSRVKRVIVAELQRADTTPPPYATTRFVEYCKSELQPNASMGTGDVRLRSDAAVYLQGSAERSKVAGVNSNDEWGYRR